MPRQTRLELPGVPLHVGQCGVNRCAIFVDTVERQHFHDLVCEPMSRHRIAVHAYVSMGNNKGVRVKFKLAESEGECL